MTAFEEWYVEITMKVIKCAAIRVGSMLFTGLNHGECLAKLKKASEQGFIVDAYEGRRFVDRKLALKIAIAAGQKINKHHPKDELLSEDLSEDKYFRG